MFTRQHHYQLTKASAFMLCLIFLVNFLIMFACLNIYGITKDRLFIKLHTHEFEWQAQACNNRGMLYIELYTHLVYKCADPQTKLVTEYYMP